MFADKNLKKRPLVDLIKQEKCCTLHGEKSVGFDICYFRASLPENPKTPAAAALRFCCSFVVYVKVTRYARDAVLAKKVWERTQKSHLKTAPNSF